MMWRIAVAGGDEDGGLAVLGVAEEGVGVGAERMASIATCTSPEVAFLNPTGQETPETSWRWTWLSVVRAPMAPQLTRPAMYCGEIMSRNSVPVGHAHLRQVEEKMAGETQAVVDLVGADRDGDR